MKQEEDIQFVDEDYRGDKEGGTSYSKIVFELVRNITKTLQFGQQAGGLDPENREFMRKRQVISFCNQTFFLRNLLEPQIKSIKKPSYKYLEEFKKIDTELANAYNKSHEEISYLDIREELAWKLWAFISYLLNDLNYFGLEGITIT